MKIKDIISESLENKEYFKAGNVSDQIKDALPDMVAFKQLRSTDPYVQYRMSVAFAAAAASKDTSNPHKFDQESAYAENMIAVAYTDAEMEIITLAAKLLNVEVTKLTNGKSKENPDVFTDSPVPKK